MAVTVVEGGGSGVEIEVVIALRVPHVGSLSACKYNGQRLVVFGGEVLLSQEGCLTGSGVIRTGVPTVNAVGFHDEIW